MLPTTKLQLSDLSHQKRLQLDLSELSPQHSVHHAIELFLLRTRTPDNGVPWSAFSRGRLIDKRTLLGDLADEDAQLTVVPEVTAGGAA